MSKSIQDDIDALRASGAFDEQWYLEQYPDVKMLNMDPVVHYLWIGIKLGRLPKPIVIKHQKDENITYKQDDTYEEIRISSLNYGFFDPEYYAQRYPDLRRMNADELFRHYYYTGYTEGRNPSALFSGEKYYKLRPDVRMARVNPLVHFLSYGRHEGIDLEHAIRYKIFYSEDHWGNIDAKPSLSLERLPTVEKTDHVKIIAFYLPQFHNDPHNDIFWGTGFTEWTNVIKAKPNFEGHDQPYFPLLGFYNLHDERWLDLQCRMAREQGISGFNIFLYDFPKVTPPLFAVVPKLVAALTQNNLEFCFEWANEPWTRRWDGLENEILINQPKTVTHDQIEGFVDRIAEFVQQPNYLMVNGRKLFNIYRPSYFDNPAKVVEIFRSVFDQRGIEIALGGMLTFDESGQNTVSKFYDIAVEYPPHDMPLEGAVSNDKSGYNLVSYPKAIQNKIRSYSKEWDTPCYPTVFPSWDNTPRRGGHAWTYVGVTENEFARWLGSALDRAMEDSRNSNNLVFINSWNEWAEGANLEPDSQYGYWKLNTIARLKDNYEHIIERQIKLPTAHKETDNKSACLWHIYSDNNIEKMCEIAERYSDIDHYVTVNISTCGLQIDRLDAIKNIFPFPVSNRGRDFMILAAAASDLLRKRYRVVAKCHFKTRNQINGLSVGDRELQYLIEQTLNAVRNAASCVTSSRQEVLYCQKDWILPQRDHLGSNEQFLMSYCQDLGIDWDSYLDTRMPSGGFFVLDGVGPVFEKLLDWISGQYFEYDCGIDDGTLAHAIERIIGAHYQIFGQGIMGWEQLYSK